MGDNDYYLLLKKGILLHCGMEDINENNCKIISIQIFKQDQNYISLTNIKRFFGLLPIASQFLPFILNSLSQFIGYHHWKDFKENVTV
jgi:hypothetical protein